MLDLPGLLFVVAFVTFEERSGEATRVTLGLHGVRKPIRLRVSEKTSKGDGVIHIKGVKRWNPEKSSDIIGYLVPNENTGTVRIIDPELEEKLVLVGGVWKMKGSQVSWDPRDTYPQEEKTATRDRADSRRVRVAYKQNWRQAMPRSPR